MLDTHTVTLAVHIPKTGGSTFRDVLKKTHKDELIYLADTHTTVTAEVSAAIASAQSQHGKAMVYGHIYLPEFRAMFPDAQSVVWLRDPVQRVISHYYYNWRAEKNEGSLSDTARMEAILAFSSCDENRNVMRKRLGQEDISQFSFVGITEEYEKSLNLFSLLFNKPATKCYDNKFLRSFMEKLDSSSLHIRHRNKNPQRNTGAYSISPQLEHEILTLNAEDVDLYMQGQLRFMDLCKSVGL